MKIINAILFILALNMFSQHLHAQDTSRIFFTTGVGIIKAPGNLSKVIDPSIAFNSGIELTNKKNWFVQVTADFNTLRYNQQMTANESPYLFQKTTGSLFMAGVNGGKNFTSSNSKWLFSVYTGGGYLNKGEPRLYMQGENTFVQKNIRTGAIYGKGGVRIGYPAPIKFLQTIYIDASWWTSPARIQGYKLNGLSFFIGSRMSM